MANTKKLNPPDILALLKEEITVQAEPQDSITELQFQEIPIKTFTADIQKLFEQYKELVSLEFTQCELESLEGFPKVPMLARLSLEQNKLDGKALKFIVDHFPKLQFLTLSGNKINELDDLKSLAKLQNLMQLDFQETPASKDKDYRATLFSICPSLQILDNMDRDGNQVEYPDEDLNDDDISNENEENELDDEDEDSEIEEAEEEDNDLAESEEQDSSPKPQKKKHF